jgi:ankyrin repeat protein
MRVAKGTQLQSTNLHVAAREGRTKTVAALLSIDADIDAKDKASRTALHYAASEGHLPVAQALVSVGADISDRDKDGKGAFDHAKEIKDEEKRAAVLAPMAGYSVLYAVATGKADLVAASVDKGCNVEESYWRKSSCLHHAAAQGSLAILAISSRQAPMLPRKMGQAQLAKNTHNRGSEERLKAGGATMPKIPDQVKDDILFRYARSGCIRGVLIALQAVANVNYTNSMSETALHDTASEGQRRLPVAQSLVIAGADVNAQDALGCIPLAYAQELGDRELEALLLQHGAE